MHSGEKSNNSAVKFVTNSLRGTITEIMVISEALFNLALPDGRGKEKDTIKYQNVMISGL